ncbi:MAG: hypothetical protein FWF44_03850 [Defluviitaleaceae bacterium]|nr:hypothetical protein [Defluviitaleaceae bacterium]
MKKKLLIIGAGSAMFTQGLITDLIERQPGGHEWSVALCDIDRYVLDGVTLLVKKMLARKNLDMEVTSSAERRDLLPGVDYVISTIGVGGRRAWEQDVFIPRKYGIFQPVGDTAMPGGISRAMRMVPAMAGITEDVRKLAPNAKFINYSNPMAVICRALDKTGSVPVTGLCTGTVDSEWYIADYMGYERSRFTTLAAGINHCTFIYDFRYDGRCVKNEIRARIERDYAALGEGGLGETVDRFLGGGAGGHLPREPFAWDFFLKYGAFPAPGDRHITEFFTEYFPGGAYYGKKLGIDAFSFEGTIAWGDKIHDEAMALGRSPGPLPDGYFESSGGEEVQLNAIMDSIERDSRRIFYANVPNRAAVPNLPPWAVIEMPAAAGADGLAPLRQASFPNELACFTCRFLAGVELTAEAALRGSRTLMEEAIMMGGYVTERSAVRKMTDELLLAQKEYLPQF